MELSSYQLHWAPSLRAHSAAVLNLAPDHLDWHGSMEAYAADKGRIYEGNRVACVYNVADKATEDLVREADVEEGCRAIGFTLGTPGPPNSASWRASWSTAPSSRTGRRTPRNSPRSRTSTRPPRTTSPTPLRRRPSPAPSGCPPRPYGTACGPSRPDAHRIAHVADVDGVAYVDDSKATNTHAAEASLAAYESIVWIAGGLAKGAAFDELVAKSAKRLRGVVLIGADRALIREALARHAPEVPVVDLDRTDTGAMLAAVQEAQRLAAAGRHGAAGPGLCLDGHVRQLQQAR